MEWFPFFLKPKLIFHASNLAKLSQARKFKTLMLIGYTLIKFRNLLKPFEEDVRYSWIYGLRTSLKLEEHELHGMLLLHMVSQNK